jgi:hypothetical protein
MATPEEFPSYGYGRNEDEEGQEEGDREKEEAPEQDRKRLNIFAETGGRVVGDDDQDADDDHTESAGDDTEEIDRVAQTGSWIVDDIDRREAGRQDWRAARRVRRANVSQFCGLRQGGRRGRRVVRR